jgi:hypothetical protein
MTTWREFLLEHAKFPFPKTTGRSSGSSADINPLQIGSIPQNWKAKYAVPDVTLVQKLSQTLDEILGNTPIEGPTDYVLSVFGRRLKFFPAVDGVETRNTRWSKNRDKVHVRNLDSHSQTRNPG